MRTMLSRAAAMLLIAFSTNISAQQKRGTVSVVGGSATDVFGVTSRALTIAPSFAIAPDPRVAFSVEGSGTKFDNKQWSLGVGGNVVTRMSLNRFVAATVNAGSSATETSYDFSYVTATVVPALEASFGTLGAYFGGRGSYAATRTAQTTQAPGGLFGDNPLTRRSTLGVARTGRALLYGASARFTGGHGETLTLGAREERGVDAQIVLDK